MRDHGPPRLLPFADVARAKRYERTKLAWSIGISTAETACLAALVVTGAALALRRFLEPWSFLSSTLLIALYLAVLGAGDELLFFWARWWRDYRLDKVYGVGAQRFRGWLWDYVKANALSGLFGLVVVEMLFWLLRASPRFWWVPAGLILSALLVVLAQLAPVIILPLFHKVKPLENDDLRARLAALAARARVRLERIEEIDLSAKTYAANAALAGLGRTRRILLGDTLLRRFTTDEVEAVLAHELGHHVAGDLWRRMAAQAAVVFFFLGLIHAGLLWVRPRLGYSSLADPAAIPFMGLVLGVAVPLFLPLLNTFLRGMERAADRYALEATGKPWALVSALERLAQTNLADPEPPRIVEALFRAHPSISRRIALCRRRAAERGLPLEPPAPPQGSAATQTTTTQSESTGIL